LEQIIVPKAKI